MKPKNAIPAVFLLLWARAAHEDIVSRANGSTFLEISKTNFRSILVVRPPDAVLRIFESLASRLYQRLANNARESRAITTLRDALLPKLISGELRVRDAERFLERIL